MLLKAVVRKNIVHEHEKELTLKRKLHYVLLCACCSLISIIFHPAFVVAEDNELVNHPVNLSGLTGLLFTAAPYTISPGTVEAGISVLSENSVRPDYTITEYPFSVTVGMSNNSELALKSSYFTITEGPTGTNVITRETGDIELSYKWDFLPQTEASMRPAVALIVTGIAPTGENSDLKIVAVSHWGMRIGIATGTEVSWKDHTLGIYADGQIAGQDLTENRLMDLYGIFNAGLIFPISKYQNLQMFMEYSLVSGKDKLSLNGSDYTALTYGLRLVNDRFNLTIGTQFMRKKIEGYDSSGRVIGLLSRKF
jgi:hypothetical protein